VLEDHGAEDGDLLTSPRHRGGRGLFGEPGRCDDGSHDPCSTGGKKITAGKA
jgi:hypothetical protein